MEYLEVETFQAPWELDLLLHVVDSFETPRILEVGAMYGGTLRHWLQRSEVVVVVDDEMRRGDDWEDWAEAAGKDLYLLQGSSHDERVVEKAHELGPYDFCFIDADHTYESVKADWENYGSLANVVALHDILPRPSYGVWRLWDEIKSVEGVRYMEICQNETLPGNEGRCGIGIVWRD